MKDHSEDEQALIRIQHQWAEARLKRDSSFPRQIEADDFTAVWFDGRIVTRNEDIKTYESDDATFTDFNIADLKVRFYGGDGNRCWPRLNQSAHENAGFKRELRVDLYIRETEWGWVGGRTNSDFGLGKIVEHGYFN